MSDPFLEIEVRSWQPVSAFDTGEILARISEAFAVYCRERGMTGHLTIHNVRSGSLFATLATLFEVADKLLDHRAILGGFVQNIRDTIEILLRSSSRPPPSAATRAVEALAAPVDHGRIERIDIYVQGSNESRIHIQAAVAMALRAARGTDPASDYLQSRVAFDKWANDLGSTLETLVGVITRDLGVLSIATDDPAMPTLRLELDRRRFWDLELGVQYKVIGRTYRTDPPLFYVADLERW